MPFFDQQDLKILSVLSFYRKNCTVVSLVLFLPVKFFSLPVVKVKGKRNLPLPASQLHCSLSQTPLLLGLLTS